MGNPLTRPLRLLESDGLQPSPEIGPTYATISPEGARVQVAAEGGHERRPYAAARAFSTRSGASGSS